MDETGFLNRTLTFNGNSYSYQIYVPVEYTPDRAWSVILFLHGADESGQDNVRQTQVGLGPALERYSERFPAIVVFPQTTRKQAWRGDMAQVALAALAQTQKEFRVDPGRIYLTGVSMGGYGTWYLALQQPDLFAALVPVCGGLDLPGRGGRGQTSARPGMTDRTDKLEKTQKTENVEKIGKHEQRDVAAAAQKLRQLPVWSFHGADDEIVPVSESRLMVEALREAGADVRYTEYEGVGHNCWDLVYSDPQWISWLLSQRRHQEEEEEFEPAVQDEWI